MARLALGALVAVSSFVASNAQAQYGVPDSVPRPGTATVPTQRADGSQTGCPAASRSGIVIDKTPCTGDSTDPQNSLDVKLRERNSDIRNSTFSFSIGAALAAGVVYYGGHGESSAAPTAGPSPLRPVRSFMRARDIPPVGVGAYGVVALRGLATSNESRERLLKLCRSYIKFLPRNDTLPVSIPTTDRMVTIWPIVNPEAKEIASDDCNYAVDKYDLFGGTSAIQDAEQQNASLSGRGPYLIGWSPSNTRGQPDKVVLVYDMSGFESQDSFDRAFMFWQQKVVSDPRLWRNGWSYEQIRVSVRDFFDTYAQSALDAIKIFGGGK